jgi:hypothetical protein
MTRIGDDVAARFHHGRNSDVDTAAEVLTTTRFRLSRGVQLKAGVSNSAVVYVGGSGVTAGTADTTDGFPLGPGDGLFLPVDSPHKVFLIAAAPNQAVHWLAV